LHDLAKVKDEKNKRFFIVGTKFLKAGKRAAGLGERKTQFKEYRIACSITKGSGGRKRRNRVDGGENDFLGETNRKSANADSMCCRKIGQERKKKM